MPKKTLVRKKRRAGSCAHKRRTRRTRRGGGRDSNESSFSITSVLRALNLISDKDESPKMVQYGTPGTWRNFDERSLFAGPEERDEEDKLEYLEAVKQRFLQSAMKGFEEPSDYGDEHIVEEQVRLYPLEGIDYREI